MNDQVLKDRVAIVTGAGGGIGLAIAQHFGELGAHVIATDLNGESLSWASEFAGSGSVETLRHDVLAEDDWAQVIARAEAAGRLDVLVNNAGIMLDTPFERAPVEDLRRQYGINVEGPFIGMQAAIPLMRSTVSAGNSTASIINISSIFGQVVGERYAAYSASKGAIRLLTKAVAAELAKDGIRVNSIHPGPTATKLGVGHEIPHNADGSPFSVEQLIARWADRIPMGRMGNVGDIAPAAAFLASEESRYITGAEIVIDGGYSII